MKLLLLFALPLITFVYADSAEARRQRRTTPAVTENIPECSAKDAGEGPVKMNELTVYMPGRGGINGSCSGGASAHKGFPACKNTLDKYIKGTSKWVHTAAQQKGGSSVLFGCWAKTEEIKAPKGSKSCHILAIADRYAKSENAGSRGVARTRYGSKKGGTIGAKVDIEVDSGSKNAKAVGQSGGASITCLGRLPGVTNRERAGRREITRMSEALTPPT